MKSSRICAEHSYYLLLFAAAVSVRLLVALSAGALSDPLNNYDYVVTPDGNLVFRNPGFFPAGGFYAAWMLFTIGGRTTFGYGSTFVVLGAVIPIVIARLSHSLFPGMTTSQAKLAGWLAVFFPPLLLLSATWRYMLAPVLIGLWHVDALVNRRPIQAGFAGSLLLLTRPDYWLGNAAMGLVSIRESWRVKLWIVFIPILVITAHNLLAPPHLRGPHNFWYNLDAGLNPRTRVAVIGYGPDLSHPESTLADQSHDESMHRRNVISFVRENAVSVLEAIVMKVVRAFDVRRDGAISQSPIENVVYTGTVFSVLVTAFLGIGALGPRFSTQGIVLAAGYITPMILLFSLDRTRVLFQCLWLMPTAYWISMVSKLQRSQNVGRRSKSL